MKFQQESRKTQKALATVEQLLIELTPEVFYLTLFKVLPM